MKITSQLEKNICLNGYYFTSHNVCKQEYTNKQNIQNKLTAIKEGLQKCE